LKREEVNEPADREENRMTKTTRHQKLNRLHRARNERIREGPWADENFALQHFALPTCFAARIGDP